MSDKIDQLRRYMMLHWMVLANQNIRLERFGSSCKALDTRKALLHVLLKKINAPITKSKVKRKNQTDHDFIVGGLLPTMPGFFLVKNSFQYWLKDIISGKGTQSHYSKSIRKWVNGTVRKNFDRLYNSMSSITEDVLSAETRELDGLFLLKYWQLKRTIDLSLFQDKQDTISKDIQRIAGIELQGICEWQGFVVIPEFKTKDKYLKIFLASEPDAELNISDAEIDDLLAERAASESEMRPFNAIEPESASESEPPKGMVQASNTDAPALQDAEANSERNPAKATGTATPQEPLPEIQASDVHEPIKATKRKRQRKSEETTFGFRDFIFFGLVTVIPIALMFTLIFYFVHRQSVRTQSENVAAIPVEAPSAKNITPFLDADGALNACVGQNIILEKAIRNFSFCNDAGSMLATYYKVKAFPAWNIFKDFSKNYAIKTLKNRLPGYESFFLNHEPFYPSAYFAFDSKAIPRASIVHAGRFLEVWPVGNSLALWCWSNTMLHQKALLLTKDLRYNEVSIVIVKNPGFFQGKGLLAYYPLGIDGNAWLEGSTLKVSIAGVPYTLSPEGDLINSFSIKADSSRSALLEYFRCREVLRKEAATQICSVAVQETIKSQIAYYEALGFPSFAALFGQLEIESLFQQGAFAKATEQCDAYHKKYNEFTEDFAILKGFAEYVQHNYDAAIQAWTGTPAWPNETTLPIEVRTYIVWAELVRDSALSERSIAALQSEDTASKTWGRSLEFQEGWRLLLQSQPQEASVVLEKALHVDGLELHVAGYFLSKIASNTYDDGEFQTYLQSSEAPFEIPLFIEWTGALGRHEKDRARSYWEQMQSITATDRDAMLVYPLLDKLRTKYRSLQ